MKNIRKDLIEKELDWQGKTIKDYKYIKLSNKVIDNILNHYNAWEITEHFYDADPGSYGLCDNYSFKDLLPDYEHSYGTDDYYQAFMRLINSNPKYALEAENIRMEFNNWIDVYGPGIWFMTQKQVNKYAKEILKSFRNINNKKDRIYFYKDNEMIHIYIYNRDELSDWHLILTAKKDKRKK